MKWWHKNQKTGKYKSGGWSEPLQMASVDCAYLYSLCRDCKAEHWVFCKDKPASVDLKEKKDEC